MSKVPVGASIAHAYGFLFGRFFQIIGTAWVPALLYGLGYYVLLSALQFAKPMPGSAALAAVSALAGFAFFIMIRSVLGISLTQEALGVRKDLTLAHFVIGPRELRLFFGYLRYYIVFILLYVAVLAVSFGAVFAAKKFGAGLLPAMAVGGTPIAVVAALALTVILAIWFVLSMLRLVFLLPPIASAEHRTRLVRAWALTRGSSLRILIVLIGTFLPAVIVFGAAAYYLIGPADFAALGQALHNFKPGTPPPLTAFFWAHADKLSLLTAIGTAVNGALLAGASAAAYRTVTGHEDPELEDDAALVAPLLAPVEEHGHHEEPADHGHHEDHGHGGHEEPAGHDDHGHGDHGHDDHGHGGHEDHGHGGHEEPAGHDDHGHGGHDDHGHDDHGNGGGHGHEDHGHGGHEDHDDHGHGGHNDHGHSDDHGGGHDSHGDHGGHGHDSHGHDNHGHDHGHGDHGHHAHGRAAAE
ncbi:MAG: hypothetical protein WDN01_01040 [Rhizomicrobium sp.]